MAQVVGWLGGGGMIAFVVTLALRCLALLGWMPGRLPGWRMFQREDALPHSMEFSRRAYAVAFFAPLVVQWASLFFAWLTLNQSGGAAAF